MKLSLLTPWCRILLEKLTGLQLVKKFPAFYGTRKFITALSLLTENYKYVEHKITLYWSGNNWIPKQAIQGTRISVV